MVSCPTYQGSGGLGQHLAKIVSDAGQGPSPLQVACLGGPGTSIAISGAWESRLFRFPPFRWNPALRVWLRHEWFDRQVARRCPRVGEVVAFMGAAEKTFQAAARQGARLVLELPNSHPANVRSLHERARTVHPIEPSWMGERFERKAVRELAMAHEIRTNSDYTSRSLVERGIDPSKIVRRHLGCDPRFASVRRVARPDGLRVATFTGSFTVFKGVPFLVDIFRRIPGDHLRLLLIGGWTDGAMKRWLENARRLDPRLSWTSGDPAPHLASASIALHPTWEDGWGYAPAEALAAGVPLVVSDQTGMAELASGGNFEILPAGDATAWEARLQRWAGEST